jgi:hypothetical protein
MRAVWLTFVVVAMGCQNASSDRDTGSGTDAPVDVLEDGGIDVSDDPLADPVPDGSDAIADPDGPCTYPAGPWAFDWIGDTVGPCSWPSAVYGAEETMTADFEVLHCDPDVQTILMFRATLTCPYCPGRIRELVDMKDHFDTYGAKWVWILEGGSSPAQAAEYFEDLGVTFGWMTDDADNSQGAYYLAETPMSGTVPWIGIIDARTMRVAYNNPLSIERIVEEMGTD